MKIVLGKILSLLVVFSLTVSAFAQTPRVNPFEVSGRKTEQNIATVDTSISFNANSIIADSLGQAKDTNQSDTIKALNGLNPFDVNHIPLKKKSVSNNPLQDLSKINVKVSDKFMDVLIFIPLALLAIVITVKANLISYLTRSVFNINMMKLTKREESNNSNLLILLYLIFFINASIFIYLIQKHLTSQEGLKIWAMCLGALMAIYLIRHIMMLLLGGIFPVKNEVSFYNYVIIVFNILFGIIIFPINIISIYLPEYTKIAIYIGLGLFIIFYIIRSLRGISASLFSIGQGILPFFIYLCTFEIAPILLIIRGVMNIKV
jgi:hypothetical protein